VTSPDAPSGHTGPWDNEAVTSPRTVAVLGSTGSIGTQALDVIARNPERFRVTALSAGSNLALVAEQAVAFEVPLVAVASGTAEAVTAAIGAYAAAAGKPAYRPHVVVGDDAAVTAAGSGADVVLNGITGAIGLRPTLAALAAGSTLALANKESLIVGGPLVKAAARPDQIVPVDSEHSAIAQSLRGGRAEEVRRLVVTASGGPFRGRSRASLRDVTPADALAHPNFSMGRVITTNSATLVNKGLEVIEAHLLFDIPFDRIDVVVHPQQMIHSMVEFVDGSTIAQAGPPRMLVPIALGLSWPERLADVDVPVDWTLAQSWDFEPLDDEAFPAVRLARQVGEAGGTYPAVYNAANEVAVDAFHDGHLGFVEIVDTVERVVAEHADDSGSESADLTVEDVMRADAWARERARKVLGLPTTDSSGATAVGAGTGTTAGGNAGTTTGSTA
jgi:1-deoxy-D-xylulose-5-phosphate reductoisomerase